MAEGNQEKPAAVRAIEARRSIGVVIGMLRNDPRTTLVPSPGVSALVSMFMEDNLCFKITDSLIEEAKITSTGEGGKNTSIILVADKSQVLHEHSKNLDYFSLFNSRHIITAHFWTDNRYNYLCVGLGEPRPNGNLRVPDVRHCRDPRAAQLEFHEIPDMVSTKTLNLSIHPF